MSHVAHPCCLSMGFSDADPTACASERRLYQENRNSANTVLLAGS